MTDWLGYVGAAGVIDAAKLELPVTRLQLWRLLSKQNEINADLIAYLDAARAGVVDLDERQEAMLVKMQEQHEAITALIVRDRYGDTVG